MEQISAGRKQQDSIQKNVRNKQQNSNTLGKVNPDLFEMETMVIYSIMHGNTFRHPVLGIALQQQTYEILCSSSTLVLLAMDVS